MKNKASVFFFLLLAMLISLVWFSFSKNLQNLEKRLNIHGEQRIQFLIKELSLVECSLSGQNSPPHLISESVQDTALVKERGDQKKYIIGRTFTGSLEDHSEIFE